MHQMGPRLEASLAIEGKFSEEGLLAMTQAEDMTIAMAKALVDELKGQDVGGIWSVMGQDSRKCRGVRMDAEHFRLVQGAVQSLKKAPIVVTGFEELLAAQRDERTGHQP